MIVEPANPVGFNEEDFEPLRQSLAGDGIDAQLALRAERGYGGPLFEVFHLFIEHRDELKQIADTTRDVILDIAAIGRSCRGRGNDGKRTESNIPRTHVLAW